MSQLLGCHNMATEQLRQGPRSRGCPPFLRRQNSITYDARHGMTPGRSSSAISGVPVGRGSHGWRGFATYQPASRYWPFQGIGTGIYLLLAAALIAVTFVIVRRRDA